MRPIHGEADIDALRRAAQAYATISAWGRAGLLEALSDGAARTPSELPGDDRAIEITAEVLAHLGLLVSHPRATDTAWALSQTAREMWSRGELDFRSDGRSLEELSRLDGLLRDGGPIRDRAGNSRVSTGGVRASDPEGSRRFMEMLYRRSADSAAETARVLSPMLPPGAAVLDLGGGHGRYAEVFRGFGARVTIFDLPLCISLAAERHGDAFELIAGDFHTDPVGGPYDLVFLSNIVHGLSEEELRALLPRLRAAVRPGGMLVFKDMFLAASGPENAACFGVMMLMYTAGGRSYAVDWLRPRLVEAGFPRVAQSLQTSFSLLIAR